MVHQSAALFSARSCCPWQTSVVQKNKNIVDLELFRQHVASVPSVPAAIAVVVSNENASKKRTTRIRLRGGFTTIWLIYSVGGGAMFISLRQRKRDTQRPRFCNDCCFCLLYERHTTTTINTINNTVVLMIFSLLNQLSVFYCRMCVVFVWVNEQSRVGPKVGEGGGHARGTARRGVRRIPRDRRQVRSWLLLAVGSSYYRNKKRRPRHASLFVRCWRPIRPRDDAREATPASRTCPPLYH